MEFANPIFLWGLLAVPLPILLHLFFKRRKTKVDFSTLQFFHRRRKYLAHRRHLREWLLLLLRVLALLCLVLALARLFLRSTPLAFSARTNVVIVLDDTLSMERKLSSGASAFSLAQAKAEEILDSLGDGDAAALVLLSGRQAIAMTRKLHGVRQLVQDAQVVGAAGSYSAALTQASEYLTGDGNPNREIFVLSDFQRNQAPSAPLEIASGNGQRLYLLPVGSGEIENLSVESIALSTRPQMLNKRMLIPYTVRNHGEKDRETTVSLSMNAETVNRVALSVPAGSAVSGSFEYVPERAGYFSGALSITDRGPALDNRRYFTLHVYENINVLFLESNVSVQAPPGHFLKVALDPVPGEALNGIHTEYGFIQEISAAELGRHHVVVLANPLPLTAAAAALLRQYMINGGTLLFFAGSNSGAQTFAAFAEPELQNLIGERVPADFAGLRFENALNALNELLQMDLLQWRRLQKLTPAPGAVVLAQSLQQPLIVEQAIGAGSLIAAAFSVRRDYCNWPELKSFPIAMIHLITYAAHDPQQSAGIECGRLLRLRSEQQSLIIKTADARQLAVPVENGEAVFADTWLPGVVTAEHALPRTVAVNAVPAESDLACMNSSEMTALIAGKVTVLKTDAALAPQIRNARQGSDLTGLFLLLLLLLLLLELLLGNAHLLSFRRRNAESAAQEAAV